MTIYDSADALYRRLAAAERVARACVYSCMGGGSCPLCAAKHGDMPHHAACPVLKYIEAVDGAENT